MQASQLPKSQFIGAALIALVATTIFAACARDLEEPDPGTVNVVTTTYPLTFFAERLGGSRVSVTQLVKPGVEAHDFEPAPSDVRTITRADVFLFNHPAFEGWALDAVTTSGSESIVIAQTVLLEAEGENHGGQSADDSHFDPHVWLNPLDAVEQVDRIISALVAADPDGSLTYAQNGDGIKVELQALDDLISETLSSCALDTVVVSHLAYGHMAERYGFNLLGLAGLSPEFESGPAHIADVITRINELGINHILREPIGGGRLEETVASDTGAEILVLHPIEVRTLAEVKAGKTYFDIMRDNSQVLKTALQCD